jgi:biotin-dependent carboxylase-like uncharacterized protein
MITVLEAPAFATVQDLGRPGFLHAAVPRAGALDPLALAAANLLVGNERDAGAIEWGLSRGEVRFERDCAVALCGARAIGTLGGLPLATGRALRARAGDRLRIERLEAGAWLYLAVSGGVDVPPVLGSRATYLPARFGGHEGRLLRAGDRLPLGRTETTVAPGPEPGEELRTAGNLDPIAIVSGPDRALLPGAAWDWLLRTEFRVSRAVSRMGYRLEAPPPELPLPGDRPSAPACPGTVQLPPGGEAIVLMADGPTVGGYLRIAVVSSTDLGRLAQRRPGEPVRFGAIDVSEARTRLRRQDALLNRLAPSA